MPMVVSYTSTHGTLKNNNNRKVYFNPKLAREMCDGIDIEKRTHVEKCKKKKCLRVTLT